MAGKAVAATIKLIDDFTSPSKKVITQAKNIEKRFNEMAKGFEHAGEIFSAVGEKMTKSVTVPMAAVGTAAIKFASDSQDAFQQFAASTGAAAESMEKYKDMVNEVYKDNFGESMTEVADAMATVKKEITQLDDSALKSCTEYAFTLSDTFGYDISESVRAADTLIGNFGIEAREAFNLISQGAQNGLDYSGEMIDSINEYSVQFKKLGLDANDMFSIFASGMENGAFNLDKIGDAVKEFSIRAIDGSDTTIAGFQAIGLNAADTAARIAAGGDSAKLAFQQVIDGLAAIDDPIKQSEAGVNLFGTMWEDLGPKVITSLSTANGAIDMTRETMEELVNTKYDTLTGALGGLWRTIQVDILQPIGDMLIPYVIQAIDAVEELVGWWNTLEPAMQKNIVKFAGIAAAVGPVLTILGKTTSGIGNVIKTIGTLRSAGLKLAAAIPKLLNPTTLVIGALVGAAVLIYKNWDSITEAFGQFKETFSKFADNVSKGASKLWDNFTALGANVGKAFTKMGDTVKGVFTDFGKTVSNKAAEVWENITTMGNTVKTVFTDFGKTVSNKAAEVWKNITAMGNAIKTVFTDFGETISTKAVEIWGNLSEFGESVRNKFTAAFDIALKTITGYFGTWFDGISRVFENVKGIMDGVVEFITGVFSGNWEKAWEGLKNIVGNSFGALEGIVKTPINAVIALVNGAIDGINNIHFTVPEWVPGIGGKGWEGLDIPHIPALAVGTDYWKGGVVQISERGGEIVDLPQGSRVYPHDESVRIAREEGEKRLSINIAKLADRIIVREEKDIDRMAEKVAEEIVRAAANMA